MVNRSMFSWRAGALVIAVASISLLAGCAKKAAETPPQQTQPPPVAPVQTTPPAQETPPAPQQPAEQPLSAGDFQPVFFDYDSYTLRDDARAALDADAKLLRQNASVKIVIEGHCDERGTAEYNQALGERRAQAAKDYLVQAGIEAARLQTISYGKERPFDPGHDEAAWSKNRRAHFALL